MEKDTRYAVSVRRSHHPPLFVILFCIAILVLAGCNKTPKGRGATPPSETSTTSGTDSTGGTGGSGGGAPPIEPRSNTPPEFITAPVMFARENTEYIYKAKAVDTENDPLTFSLKTAPSGMTINEITGEISWVPTSSQGGEHPVDVVVSDGRANTRRDYTIAVETSAVIASQCVTTGIGGTVEVTDSRSNFLGSRVEIPSGVLPQDGVITLEEVSNPSYLPEGTPVIKIFQKAVPCAGSSLSGLQNKPVVSQAPSESGSVQIVLTYTDALLKGGVAEADLKLFTADTFDLIKWGCDDAVPLPVVGYICYNEVSSDNGNNYRRDFGANSFIVNETKVPGYLCGRLNCPIYYAIGTSGSNSAEQLRHFEIIKGSLEKFKTAHFRNLVLIHGVLANSDDWIKRDSGDPNECDPNHEDQYHKSQLIDYVCKSDKYDNILFYNYPWSESIADNGNELIDKINSIKKPREGTFDIIAHSMGGAVARYAIERRLEDGTPNGIQSKVRNLFMLATPNFGVKPDDPIAFLGTKRIGREHVKFLVETL